MNGRDLALIAAGIAVGAAAVTLWNPGPRTYEECVVYEMRGQDALFIHAVRPLCEQRFGKPSLASASRP